MNFRHVIVLGLGVVLAGCAESATKPDIVMGLSPQQQNGLVISDVTGQAAQGVVMLPEDISRITQSIKLGLPARSGAANSLRINILFTRYDSGSAVARAMLIGLGQIHLDGQVQFIDAGGAIVGRYNVSKTFALGGLAGAITSMNDVEKGFEASVVDLVKNTAH